MQETKRIVQVPVKAFQPHNWQLDILQAFDERTKRFFLLCWHRRARKTTLLLNILIKECIKNPKKVYGYIAPTYTQAKAIIWRDPNMLTQYLPTELVKRKNETELYVEFTNGSILAIKGADNPDSLRGMDFQGVGIDEWALMNRIIWEEILRPVITQDKTRWAVFAFTPKGINHAHEYWAKSLQWVDWSRSMLKSSESNILDKTELLKAKEEMTHALYEQEMECSFVSREEKSLITSEMLDELNDVILYPPNVKKLIACDPSEGGDECVIKVFENTKVVEELILHENNTMIISGHIQNLGYKYGTRNYAGDVIGCGKGIADDLTLKGWHVVEIQSATSALRKERFYNSRTEMWWYTADQIRQKMIYPIGDEETKRQLVAPKYEVIDSNGKIRVEPKKFTKELLGKSPDRGDCYVYGIWGLQFVDAEIDATPRMAYAPQPMSYRPMSYGRKLVHR